MSTGTLRLHILFVHFFTTVQEGDMSVTPRKGPLTKKFNTISIIDDSNIGHQ